MCGYEKVFHTKWEYNNEWYGMRDLRICVVCYIPLTFIL